MKKLRFLMDCDGVVAQFTAPMLALASTLSGREWTDNDITSYDMFSVIPREYEAQCFAACKEAGHCASLQPYPGAIEAVAELRKLVDLKVVTSPIHGPHWYFERVEWCMLHLGCSPGDVVFRTDKQYEDGDILLDDNAEHVNGWAARRPLNIALLFDRPWNRGAHFIHNNICRVQDWNEVLTTVAKYRIGWL